jgi:ABC-2 type transport system ATP-binding protein
MTEQPGESVVTVRDLTRKFRRKTALDGVSLEVKPGMVYGLVGENGAGKTTLIRHILGTLKAKAGQVRVFGMNPVNNPVKVLSRIGYLSEDRDLPGWMRIGELMWYTQAFYPGWDEKYAEELREHFRLDADARIRQLSRGEKAKAGLLAALAYRPDLLLLDEPSSGLDVSSRQDILGAIVRTVADEGRTVLFSSHLLDEVERVADHVCMIHAGRVLLDGPLEELRSRYLRRVVHFEEAVTRTQLPDTAVHAEGEGREWTLMLECESGTPECAGRIIEESPPSLEQLFLALTARPAQKEATA